MVSWRFFNALFKQLNCNKPTYLCMIILILAGQTNKTKNKNKNKNKTKAEYSHFIFALPKSMNTYVHVFVYMVFVVYDLVRRWTDWPLLTGKWTRKVSCQWENLVLTYSNSIFECSSGQLPFSFTVPVLDRILQPSTSVILGPVWVTRGAERFSPKGAYHFITTLLFSTKDRLKQSKAYKQQVWKLMFSKKKGGGRKENKLTTHRFNLRQNCWDRSIYFLSLRHTTISSNKKSKPPPHPLFKIVLV